MWDVSQDQKEHASLTKAQIKTRVPLQRNLYDLSKPKSHDIQ